ncbi:MULTISPECIES: MFS transporter [Burkholderia]|uniref:Major facilitator superfamily transporter n=1 Tax=Burkholderia paludis TaxID=1506587 RepID=A0A6P2PEJ6_9BURK|nr:MULTISPECIES: MFS transporter [Burkholderia]CAB3760033.1 Riboflavin transporter RibZ [Burkholderia paludis]VWC06255.1 major facilitator superfamily transporter [Burkholderia paludis]
MNTSTMLDEQARTTSNPARAEAVAQEDMVSTARRRMCMAALMTAAILAALDTTIANTALPEIAVDLQASDATIIWVTNAYQIAMIATLLPFAALGESMGYRRVFTGGLALFGIASAICGGASTLALLVAGRAMQGVGAAAIMSVIAAFIRHIHPPTRLGRGLSTNALVVAIGFTLGPVVASSILAFASWHWLFRVNVPVAAAAIGLAALYLPDVAGGRHRFESVSAALCTAFLGLLMFGVCMLENGGGSLPAILCMLASLACAAVLMRKQRGHPAPMLAVDLMAIRVVRLSSLTSICAFATQSLALVSLPFLLQGAFGMPVTRTGFVIAAWPLLVAVMAIVVAPLSDRYPSGLLCSVGLALLTLGMASLATMSTGVSSWGIAARLGVCGIGFGMFQSPNMREIMSGAATARSGGASAIVAISRLMGQTLGAGLVAQCFHWWPASGSRMAVGLGGACALLGCIVSAMRLKKSGSV